MRESFSLPRPHQRLNGPPIIFLARALQVINLSYVAGFQLGWFRLYIVVNGAKLDFAEFLNILNFDSAKFLNMWRQNLSNL